MRRTYLIVLVSLAGALTLGACGGDDVEEDEAQPARTTTGHFVGKTGGNRAAVAVVARGKGTTRKVSVYVSDGKRIAEWFTSKTAANPVTLTSEDKDAEVKLELANGVAYGNVKLPGQSLSFRAPPRTGGEGLYLATITKRGFSSRSATGVRVSGQHSGRTSESTADFPDGRSVPFTVRWSGHVRSGGKTLDRPPLGDYRWIVTEGQFFGAKRQPAPSTFIDATH